MFYSTKFKDRQKTARRDVGLVVALMDQKNGIPIQMDWATRGQGLRVPGLPQRLAGPVKVDCLLFSCR